MKISLARQFRIVPITLIVTILAIVAGCSSPASATPTVALTSTNTPQPTEPALPATTELTTQETPTIAAMEEIEPGLLALTDISQLQSLFNANQGSPRLVLFLTTGCPSCLAGAEWINKSLLSPNPDADLKVYAIWFPSVPDNELPQGSNRRWDSSLLNDSRVVNIWDEDHVATRWFAANQPYEGTERASFSRGFGNLKWGDSVWDIYFLYSPDAQWSDTLDGLVDAHYPILLYRETLRSDLTLTQADLPAAQSATYILLPDESTVSYGVQEKFLGRESNYAIGVTNQVEGEINLNTQNPSLSTISPITVDIKSFTSDNILRDERIREEFLESAKYPKATFTPGEIKGLSTTPYTEGDELTFEVDGDLTVREVTVPAVFQVKAHFEGGRLIGVATTQVKMSDFGFQPPVIGQFIATEDEVDITFDFVAVPK